VPVKTDWEIAVTLENILKAESGGRKRREVSPHLKSIYEEVIQMGTKLLEPKLLYEKFPVKRIAEEVVELEGGHQFHSSHLAKFLDGAAELVVMCRTIGPHLEAQIKEWQQTDMMKAFILDTVGSVAMSNLGRQSFKHLEAELANQGLETSVAMSPGQLDWNLTDQGTVFELLQPGQIGVSLNPSFIMTPIKSSTAVFGIGDGLAAKRDGIPCTKCSRREECNFRKDLDDHGISGSASGGSSTSECIL